PGRVGPLPEGDDRLLADQPGHRVPTRDLDRPRALQSIWHRWDPSCRPWNAVPGLPGPLHPQRRRGDRLQLLLTPGTVVRGRTHDPSPAAQSVLWLLP